jgi:hypothetical protein
MILWGNIVITLYYTLKGVIRTTYCEKQKVSGFRFQVSVIGGARTLEPVKLA